MCGRYVAPDQAAIERAWHIGRHNSYAFVRRFNVAPTSVVPILRLDPESGALELAAASWGLIPGWWKEAQPPRFTFNARCEEAAAKPMWREPLPSARCLVPAEGWYEWQAATRVDPRTGEIKPYKQPQFIRRPDGRLFCFAGVIAQRQPPGADAAELSCAILTMPAAPALAAVHERMPAVLPDSAHGAWLDPGLRDPEQAVALVRGCAETAFEHYPVSPRVNAARNDDPALIEPVAVTALDEAQGKIER